MRGTSLLIEGPAGSIGGITFSRVQSGFTVLKKKMKPSIRKSLQSVKVKSTMSILVNHWKVELTSEDRDDWNDAAAQYEQSKGGVSYSISGYNLFVGFNSVNYLYRDTILDAPTIFSGRIATPSISIGWNDTSHLPTITPDPENGAFKTFVVQSTNAVHSGMSYRHVRYRNLDIFDPQETYPQDINMNPRGDDGTFWIRYFILDNRGGISSAAEATNSYTYS